MPNVFNYLNYRTYLKDFYEEQKAKNPVVSYKYLANKAGFKSKSFFHEVISGRKNLSKDSLFSLQKILLLPPKSFSYFEQLVAFNQTEDHTQKDHIFQKLVEYNKRSNSQIVRKDQYEFYSHWYHNTIREVIGMFDFKEDYSRLAQCLAPPISPKEAKESVKLLERLGLIRKKGKRYEQVDASITTGDEVASVAVKNFHLKNLGISAISLQNCPANERDISSIVASLSPEGFATVKDEIQRFRKKLMEIVNQDKNQKRVYTINFQLFPTTKDTVNGGKK